MLKRIQLECRGKSPEEVKDLNLDNCRCTGEPEGLTDEFKTLCKLSMVKAGLTTLKGFPNLANLERLDLSDNRISGTLSCLKGCTSLTHLNLSGNKIKTLDALETLGELPNLTNLDLTSCDVTKVPQYKEEVFGLVPSLQFLDGYDANGQEATDSDEDEDEEENGQDENNVDGSEEDQDDDEEDDDDDDEEVDDELNQNPEVVRSSSANRNLNQAEDEDEDDDSDVDSEDDEYDLAYIDGDDIQDEDDDDDEDYEGGVEQDDEEIEDGDEDAAGESPRGVKRKHQEEEEGGDDDDA